MFLNNAAILMAIEEAEELTTKQLTYVTDVRSVALRYLCNSLVRRGYLEQNNPRGYRITFRGKGVLLGTIRETKSGFQASVTGLRLRLGEGDDVDGNMES